MSEPFYYGPWDIEKIQNDIKELQESGGSGSGGSALPTWFPDYVDNVTIEVSTDGETFESLSDDDYMHFISMIRYTYITAAENNQDIVLDFNGNNIDLSEYSHVKLSMTASKPHVFYMSPSDELPEVATFPLILDLEDYGDTIFAITSVTDISDIDDFNTTWWEFKFIAGEPTI